MLVTAIVDNSSGAVAEGYGESAALPPVTRETQKDALFGVLSAAGALRRLEASIRQNLAPLTHRLDQLLPAAPVARAGVETAVLDAVARLLGVPYWRLLAGEAGPATMSELVTDITIPIWRSFPHGRPRQSWWAKGFGRSR